jgi:hypothetical protein
MFHANLVEKIKIHFIFNKVFFPENRVLYEKMWKNMVEPDKLQTIH